MTSPHGAPSPGTAVQRGPPTAVTGTRKRQIPCLRGTRAFQQNSRVFRDQHVSMPIRSQFLNV